MGRSAKTLITKVRRVRCLWYAAILLVVLVSIDSMGKRHLDFYTTTILSSETLKSARIGNADNCSLLIEHMRYGRWNHQFAFSNTTDLIQVDPRLQQDSVSITNESLNELSVHKIYLSEEMNWLHGSNLPPSPTGWGFGKEQCTRNTPHNDVDRGISYLSTMGNQCGCGTEAFQPSHSYWELNRAVSRKTNLHNYDLLSKSPSMKVARRFAQRNQTLCFAGDSVEFQFYSALKNNLHRVELLHQEHFNKSIVNVSTHLYPLQYSTNTTSNFRPKGYRFPDDFWMLATDFWETTVTFTNNPLEGFRFKYYKHYMWAPWLYEHMETCDVIIMNHGLHYPIKKQRGMEELYADTTAAIMYLANFTSHSENRVAIWRSSLPQHFDTPDGHYPDRKAKVKQCVAIKEDYISQQNNTGQEYTKIHDRAFSSFCSSESSLCGHLQHTCTVNTHAVDVLSVYYYWVKNNLKSELEHAKHMNPNVTGNILEWPLFDLFDVPMWHAKGKSCRPVRFICHVASIQPSYHHKFIVDDDCSHYCYVPALYEAAFQRLDLLLSLA